MGIDRSCDDPGGISNGGGKKSCILITLEKDLPELSGKIPQELEGYAVHVVRQSSSIPTMPVLTEDQAIDIMKADIEKRVENNVTVYLYLRDSNDSANINRPLPLIYYDQEENLVYHINGSSNTVIDSCAPSISCFPNIEYRGVDEFVADRLVYFLDGSYSGEGKSAPAYYFIDAMNGQVVWLYIGEDIYPELKK